MQVKMDEFEAEERIPANDSVRLLDEMVEEMDLRVLKRAYKRTGRGPATNPSTLLKIMLYGNMEGNYTSRGLAKA